MIRKNSPAFTFYCEARDAVKDFDALVTLRWLNIPETKDEAVGWLAYIPPFSTLYPIEAFIKQRPLDSESFHQLIQTLIPEHAGDCDMFSEIALTVAEYKRQYPVRFYASVLNRKREIFKPEKSLSADAVAFWKSQVQKSRDYRWNCQFTFYSFLENMYDSSVVLVKSDENTTDFRVLGGNQIAVPSDQIKLSEIRIDGTYGNLISIRNRIREDEDAFCALISDAREVEKIRGMLRIVYDSGRYESEPISTSASKAEVLRALDALE